MGIIGMITNDDYLTGYDLLRWLGKLDVDDLSLPIAVSTKVSGYNKPYFDDEPVTYLVRIARQRDKDKDFNGWALEGLTLTEIKKAKKK